MVRKLLRSVREYKTSSLLAPLFVTCEVILEVIIPMSVSYTHLDVYKRQQQELTFCVPTHGAAPEKANEIATTDLALKALGVEPEIGAEVPLEFELRGKTYHYDMVLSGWWEASNDSVSVATVSEQFIKDVYKRQSQGNAGIQHGKDDRHWCGCAGTGSFRRTIPAVKRKLHV